MKNTLVRQACRWALAVVVLLFAQICTASATHIMYQFGQPLAGTTISTYISDVAPGIGNANDPPVVQQFGHVVNIYLNVPYEPGPEETFLFYTQLGPLDAADYQVNVYAAIYPVGTVKPEYSLRGTFPLTPVPSANMRRTLEYYYPVKDHYFITAEPSEIAALDSGHFPGWTRTGQSFWSFVPAQPVPSTLTPVCRFYGLPSAGLDSHFFSAGAVECQYVSDHWSYAWQIEAQNVFEVVPLDSLSGHCPATTTSVYRLYNNQPDINHRYTIFPTTRDMMVAQGWILEGVVWCSAIP